MSENKKMSSPYAILDNRPLDQWKVTELKEELKRRKLMTKGLKEDLVKRLDEVIRAEMEENKKNVDNGFDNIPEPDVESNKQTLIPPVSERTMDTGITEGMNVRLDNESMTEKLDSENRDAEMGNRGAELGNKDAEMDTDRTQVDDSLQPSGEDTVLERQSIAGTESTVVEELQVVEEISVDTSVTVSETIVTELASSGQELPTIEIQNQNEVSDSLLEDVKSKSLHEEAKLNSSDFSNQVDVVSQVRSDSISIDTISITEKNELKDNVIADDVKLELDVKPEMAQSSFSNDVLDSGKPQADNVGEPHEDKVICGDKDVNSVESVDIDKKNDSGDVGSSEKLNLDRSSGDDSMEEDASESKQIDSKLVSDEVGDRNEKLEASIVMEDGPVDAMVEDIPAEKKIVSIEKRNDLVVPLAKRKLHDQEAPSNSETTKRQRRWNSEGLKVPESQNANHSASNTPKDAIPSAAKRSFSRSDSTVSEEVPKERIVPPSPKPPTNSLRIDHFLRPFTLKAVQELLGRTGTVVSFWMDHIKTHCYVTYSSVEEAIETRNAVYNLQWPANGGRLLLAEFVDPQDVKVRVEAPVQSPATTPVGTARTLPPPPAASNLQPPQPSPRLPVQRQQLPPPPPLPLPPPPPLSNPPPVKERALPPPPPLPEKVEPPIVTLDDLFRKTKATPRIYYLPLSDEQVAAKLKAQGKNAKQ